MKTYDNLFGRLISPENLENAYWKARKHKSHNPVVMEFGKHWRLHIAVLHRELKLGIYKPANLKTFILRDPKTRKICVSDFRDRVVHHALVSVLMPIFEPRFIYDSYASRRGKGALKAINRFQFFMRKVTKNGKLVAKARNNNAVEGFVFKVDIKHYFDNVDHNVLLGIINKRVVDVGVLWLVKVILDNYDSGSKGKGMPLGNWTSQFFANVYLNELDQFVKHNLLAKYYIRYVDDFVVMHNSKTPLQEYERKIRIFLETLKLELHPSKCKITSFCQGTGFLGFRIFYYFMLVKQRNIRKLWVNIKTELEDYSSGLVEFSDILSTLQGWNAYAQQGNTYHLRNKLTNAINSELIKRSAKQVWKQRC